MGFAAISYGQTSFGVKAGLTLPKLSFSEGNTNYTTDAATGFYLTGYANLGVAKNLSVQPGISLQNKGGKFSSNSGVEFEVGVNDVTMNLMYIEVPVNVVYSIPAGPGNVFVGAGPYAAYGASIKMKIGNESESGSFDEADLNAFDAGVNFLAGYKLTQGFLVNVGYGLGLANVAKDSGDATMKNKVFSVGVGFQF